MADSGELYLRIFDQVNSNLVLVGFLIHGCCPSDNKDLIKSFILSI